MFCFGFSALSISNRLNLVLQITKTKLSNLNLFHNRSTNAEKIRQQLLTTRLYIITTVAILIIFVLYTSLNKRLLISNIPLSNLAQYEQLELKYRNAINCPCSEISIQYKVFIELEPSYDEVCSSSFVSQEWIDYLFENTVINDRSFHTTASVQFQGLASLCRLSKETVNLSLTQFYASKFISDQLISDELFHIEMNSTVTSFQKSVPQGFKRTLDMIRGIIYGNFMISVYQTNWEFTAFETNNYSPIYANPVVYNSSCSCGISAKCSQLAMLNGSIIDGLVIGCYPLESILQSSLQCFYNQICLEFILLYFGTPSSNVTFHRLSSRNQYGINEKVEQMIERLFVDNWNTVYSYEKYFQQCRPSYCTYSLIQDFDVVHLIVNTLSLYAGLSTVLGLVLPVIARIIFKLLNRRQTRIVPIASVCD